jgi:pimeloyl-ACP methyl ester carboxylesterase
MVVGALATTTALSLPAAASSDARTMPKRCGHATRAGGAESPGAVPVLFVHGFSGSPHDFSHHRGGAPSMLQAVEVLSGVSVYTFDYSKHALQWVTDQAIGPALAQSIRCLAFASGRKVVVVAHSMGGLATRLAQGQVVDGRAVSESVARVVTIGTPTRGVILLSFTNNRFSDTIVQTAVDAVGKACGKPAAKNTERPRLCELLDAANAPAVTAMAPGSARLAALPPWGAGVVVHPIAANLRLRISAFGVGTTVSLGDIVATVGSATADASAGQHPLEVRCPAELDNLVNIVDDSPCSHTNELGNHRIIDAVIAQVRAAVGQAEKRSLSV